MPIINFILADGTQRAVETNAGTSVMQSAKEHDIAGIESECGGYASCATCHVYVDEAWLDRLPALPADQDELLDGVLAERKASSRLSCQVIITEALDGIYVAVPQT
jgi:2Fe-2S ferredoxin